MSRNLLTDATYDDVMFISINKFTHYHCNKTKRKLIHQKTNKLSDITNYLKDMKTQCIIHGPSNMLSSLQNDIQLNRHIIIPKLLNDDDVHQIFEKKTNDKNMAELELWLSRLLHPQYGKRLVFGKDIQKRISDKQIKTLYCTSEMAIKINKRVPKDLMIFEIIIVQSHGDDIAKKLQNDFNGLIGITFY